MSKYLSLLESMSPSSGRQILEDGTAINAANLADRINQGMTAFNELTVVEPRNQINIESTHPVSKLKDIVEATAGTVTQLDGQFRVATDALGTGDVLFRTLDRGRYEAGLDAVTGIGLRIPTRPTGNQVIEWGPTDFQNGFVVGEDANGMFTGVYRGGVLESVSRRDAWNDPQLNTLDPKKLNVYRISVRWYGRGPFKLSLATESMEGEGRISRADTTNLLSDGPITYDPNQPISVRVRNNGTSAPLEVYVCGRQFSVYGQSSAVPRATSEYSLERSVPSTGFVPLISFRQKSTPDYATISTALDSVKTIASAASIVWQVRAFNTLTGASWVSPRNTDSGSETALEVDTAATAMTGGIVLYEGLQASGQGNSPSGSPGDLPNHELPSDGTIITLCAMAVSGTATVSSVFTISERW